MDAETEEIIKKYGGVCRECGPYSLQAIDFRTRYADFRDPELKKWFKAVSMFIAANNIMEGKSNGSIDDTAVYFEECKGILNATNTVLEHRVNEQHRRPS